MRSLQSHIGAASRGVGGHVSQSVALAPDLELAGFRMRFARNEEIFAEEDPADYVYQVISGAARSARVLEDGRRQVMSFHFPGELFGLESGPQHRCSAEAVADCEIGLVKRAAMEQRAENDPKAARLLWDMAGRDLGRLSDHVLLLGRKTASERVGDFLMEMAGRAPPGPRLNLLMPRSDIADYLGLTIETVSRTLAQLERRRAIDIQGARHIVLNDLGPAVA
jgi:CRP/FNR family nitrogen fixation transcriptional regulator